MNYTILNFNGMIIRANNISYVTYSDKTLELFIYPKDRKESLSVSFKDLEAFTEGMESLKAALKNN